MDRRSLLKLGLAAPVALLSCRQAGATSPDTPEASVGPPFGPLKPVSDLLSLPEGFRYVVLQQVGDAMSDGVVVPDQPDGMCCHEVDGRWVLLRNHELSELTRMKRRNRRSWVDRDLPRRAFDPRCGGGVARVVLDPRALKAELSSGEQGRKSAAVLSSNAVLMGTDNNCAGGKVDEGWVTCEETHARAGDDGREQPHGWAFLCRHESAQLGEPERITSWGRLKREGIALDRRRGWAFMTEDDANGLLYRFVAKDRRKPYGDGVLQALVVDGVDHMHPGERFEDGQRWDCSWVTIDDPAATERKCLEQGKAKGATRFNRNEGLVLERRGDLVFISSTAGPTNGGQVWRLSASNTGGTLELLTQVRDRSVLSMPDNVCLAPWGDLVMSEDNYDQGGGCKGQFIRAMDHTGRIVDVAFNRNNDNRGDLSESPGAEFAGVCFSPDGTVMFVNLQQPHSCTLAIMGPWRTV